MDDTDARSLEPANVSAPVVEAAVVVEEAAGEAALDVAALLAECEALAG